jgi:hypothetical protein
LQPQCGFRNERKKSGLYTSQTQGLDLIGGVKTGGNFTFSGAVSWRISSRTWTMAAAACSASSADRPQNQTHNWKLAMI